MHDELTVRQLALEVRGIINLQRQYGRAIALTPREVAVMSDLADRVLDDEDKDRPAVITVAFDVDGCLRDARYSGEVIADEDVRWLLILLARFEQVRIHVWSGSGELYARQVAREIGIAPHVNSYSSKSDKSIKADLTFDDESVNMGVVNIQKVIRDFMRGDPESPSYE